MADNRVELSNEELDLMAETLSNRVRRPELGGLDRHAVGKAIRDVNDRRADRAKELKRLAQDIWKIDPQPIAVVDSAGPFDTAEQQAISRVYEERQQMQLRQDSYRNNALRAAMDWLKDPYEAVSASDLLDVAATFERFLAGKNPA